MTAAPRFSGSEKSRAKKAESFSFLTARKNAVSAERLSSAMYRRAHSVGSRFRVNCAFASRSAMARSSVGLRTHSGTHWSRSSAQASSPPTNSEKSASCVLERTAKPVARKRASCARRRGSCVQ